VKRRIIAATAVLSFVLAGAAAAASQSSSQTAAVTSPQAAHFKKAVGTWDATVNSLGQTSKGSETVRILGDGMWLLSDFESEMAGTPFQGHGITGYDAQNKKYTGVWVDTMSPMPMHMEGTLDASGKVLTMIGDMPDPESPGKTIKATMVETWPDANTRVFTMNIPGPDGKSMEMMKIEYKRRK
jgi:hypothetical protein